MHAVRLHARGGPEQLVYEEVPRPTPDIGEALVRVRAASLTPTELTWDETYSRNGQSRLPSIPGHEIAGIVETLGPGVSDLRVGDEVYALTSFDRDGGDAEYVAVRAADLAPKPRSLDFISAAAVPLSALTAWQALFDRGGLQAGQRVLIHGAAGGVGSLAVPLARWRGAHVTATASARHSAFLQQLGVDELVDYGTTRFEDVVRNQDVVLDTIGGETQARSWRVLRPGGVLVSLVAPPSPEQARAFGVRGVFFIVEPNRSQLIELGSLFDAGILQPVISEVLPLAQAREAFERASRGHLRGKIVLSVEASA